MSALTLTLKTSPEQRIDMSPLSCHLLKTLSITDIAALTLQSGKRKLRVDELFTLKFQDDLQQLGRTRKKIYVDKSIFVIDLNYKIQ